MCVSEGGCNAKNLLSDAQLETSSVSVIHKAVMELCSQDFVKDGHTYGQGVLIG